MMIYWPGELGRERYEKFLECSRFVDRYACEHKIEDWWEIPDDAPEEVVKARDFRTEVYKEINKIENEFEEQLNEIAKAIDKALPKRKN